MLFVLFTVLSSSIMFEKSSFSQESTPPKGSAPAEVAPRNATNPPPEMAMLTSIDENLRGRYTVVYWESQLKDGVVAWISKSVEKEANLDSAVFHVIGGRKGVKGANAIESLRKRLPVPVLLSKSGKDLDPYYEMFYRPGVVVISYPSMP